MSGSELYPRATTKNSMVPALRMMDHVVGKQRVKYLYLQLINTK